MARVRKAPTEKSSAQPDRPGRIAQMRTVWAMTRKADPKLALKVFGPAIVVLAVLVGLGILLGHPIYFSILAIVGAVLTATFLFGRRATASM